jgi:hypothetical protein
VVGEAAAVLGGARGRIAAAVGVVAILLVYDATAMRLPDLSDWGDVFWTGIVLGVPLFGLLWLALPLAQRGREWLLGAVGVFAAVAIATSLLDVDGVANIAKLLAAGFAGFLFVSFFEDVSWLVAVAVAITIADTISVWRGPTHYIVTKQPNAFAVDSVAFAPPGERVVTLRWKPAPADGKAPFTLRTWRVVDGRRTHLRATSGIDEGPFDILTDAHIRYAIEVEGRAGRTRVALAPLSSHPSEPVGVARALTAHVRKAASRLGLTDVVFFAVFLAGAVRFGLRRGWTWVGLVLGVAASGAASLSDPFGIGGVPALPFISVGFLLPNADLLWRRLRSGRRAESG